MAARVQVAISADGAEIVGRVRGQGPPIVLVHGAWGDGEVAYEALVPHLADRFTCYTPSTRGRGLFGDNPDHSPPRLQEDVTAFVDSIGEPVCLVGWSGGARRWVRPPKMTVAAVAIYEPGVIGGGEDDIARLGAAMQQWARRLQTGGSSMRLTPSSLGSAPTTRLPPWRRHPSTSNGQAASPRCSDSSSKTCPTRGLGRLTRKRSGRLASPVLLLGEQTLLGTFFADVERYVSQHVVDAHVRELPGVGHFAPLLEPEPIAKELISSSSQSRRYSSLVTLVPPTPSPPRG